MQINSMKIKLAMTTKKLNQQSLADLSGVNRFTISQILNDQTADVKVSTLQKIVGVLDISMSELFAEEAIAA